VVQRHRKNHYAIVARFGYGKAYETLKEMAENNGYKFYELQRFCDTIFAQSERKVYVSFMRYWYFILPALEELVKGAEAERRAPYEAWLGKTKDFHWVANLITLADLLGLCMNVSLKMQTVDVLQWELLETEDEFVKASDFIRAELRAKKGFPPKYFPFFHAVAETPSSSNGVVKYPCTYHLDHLKQGRFMGVDLNTNGVEMEDGNADKGDVVKQGPLHIGYDVADWCENVARSFRNRYDGNEAKQTFVLVIAQCVDLRLFFVSSYAPFSSFDGYLEARVSPNLLRIYTWMVEKGKINMAGFSVCWTQCKALANAMHEDVVSFKVENPEDQHRWHADKEGKTAVYETVIQEENMTKSTFYTLCSWFVLMYIHCVLKICNEAVVESMCSVVAKHALGTRGLIFDMYVLFGQEVQKHQKGDLAFLPV
jgi:hypothetical protein